MTNRLVVATLTAVVAGVLVAVLALPASADQRTFRVRLVTGQVVTVTVDAPPCVPMNAVSGLPGTPIQELTSPNCPSGGQSTTQQSSPPPQNDSGGQAQSQHGSNSGSSSKPSAPSGRKGNSQKPSGSNKPASSKSRPQHKSSGQGGSTSKPAPQSSTPAPSTPALPGGVKPNFFDTLPGPTTMQSVPNFVINNFNVPIFLLPIYEAAGINYGIRWEYLAAINEIETDYGRDLSVSSAGAVGWMQFLPATWKTYGVDATDSGRRDPYNPADAIFAAARYLKAAGGDTNIRGAVFAYNHASWYVDSVMMRAKLLASYPAPFIASLEGLTQGRFPVADPKAHYANDNIVQQAKQHPKLAGNATTLDVSQPKRDALDIYARKASPVIAADDGVISKMGTSKRVGRYVVLQDVYGNSYTYSELGSVARFYPVPKENVLPTKADLQAVQASRSKTDPHPTGPATAGVQSPGSTAAPQPPPSSGQRVSTQAASRPAPAAQSNRGAGKAATTPAPAPAQPTYKARLFAHPERPKARSAGGQQQILNAEANALFGQGAYNTYASTVYQLNPRNAVLHPLKVGATVVAGTILGRVGQLTAAQAPHLHFQMQPAGKGAPVIDPKPVVDGWRLLESTNIYRTSGKDVLYKSGDNLSIGQVLLFSQAQLEKRVLSDPRIQIYACGRRDIATGQIDRRVLATLEYLAESGLYPTVSALKCGHSEFTSSGNVSEHSTGDAVDISAINGIPILGHQQPGGITEQTVRRLMLLQGTMQPHQIISLLSLGGSTLALPDHYNHIHVGFRPMFGANSKLGQQTASILDPSQWRSLVSHLASLSNPTVPTGTSKYAIPDNGHSSGH